MYNTYEHNDPKLAEILSEAKTYAHCVQFDFTPVNVRYVVVTNNPQAAKEIATTAKNSAYEKVKLGTMTKVSPSRKYRVILYDFLSDHDKTEFNSYEKCRELFPPLSTITVISTYHYSGTYRQQNICRVLVTENGVIKDVTGYVGDVVGYDYKHEGIHCDTSAYGQNVRDKLAWALYQDSQALAFTEM